MTPEQIDLVKATVPVLRENGVALTDYFYGRMLNKHPDLKQVFNMGHQRNGAQAQALAGAVLAYAENIEDPSVLLPVIELINHKHVSLNIQAPDYEIVGENLLHSISEVLNVPMQDPLIDAWGAAYNQLAALFIQREQTVYDEHMYTEGSWLGWRKFKILKKVTESPEITSFYLVPTDQKQLPVYKAGQYISVRVFVDKLGIKQPRQYSLSTSPQSDYFRISVKREDRKTDLDEGMVSSTLHSLAEGAEIEVSAPTGNFYLLNTHKNNVLISGGVGITPMLAMLNQLITEGMPNATTFIHASRSREAHPMRSDIQALKTQYPNLELVTAYESLDAHDTNQDFELPGRLDLQTLNPDLLPQDADYYLCGPMPFMQAQRNALLNIGIAEQNIHTEAFGTGGVKLT